MKHSIKSHVANFIAAWMLLALAGQALAQPIARENLAEALAQGGYVIVMRHANSPRALPDAAAANPDNISGERQLDETGRRDATAMGAALARLMIPVEEVLSSPTYRAMETARLLGFPNAVPTEELSNEGMQAAGDSSAAWLRAAVARGTQGGNRLLITHAPNVNAAFPDFSAGMGEGEALIFDPRGSEGPLMIQRIRIDAWADLQD